jgi:mRNA interferase MazF
VVIMQANFLTESRVGTVLVVPVTSNLHWEGAPGNVRLSVRDSGLTKPSVVNVSQVMPAEKSELKRKVKALPQEVVDRIEQGLVRVFAIRPFSGL